MFKAIFPSKKIILLLLLTFIIRLPFFFDDTINDEESAYIILGQWILNGNLPGIDLHAGKPPLPFFLYALIIYFFGKSIIFFRITASLFVFTSSWILYSILEKKFKANWSFIGALLYIILVSSAIDDTLQTLILEHISNIFMLISFYLIINTKSNYKNYFFIGLLIGVATQCRINLATLALSLIFIPFLLKKIKTKKIFYCFFIIFGGVTSLLPTLIIYIYSNNLYVLYTENIYAPLNFVQQESIIYSFLKIFFYSLNLNLDYTIINNIFKIIFSIIFFLISFFGIIISTQKQLRNKNKDNFYFLLIFYLIFILVGIIITNRPYPHYLAQIFPFFCFFFIYFISILKKKINIFIILILLTTSSLEISKKYYDISIHYLNKKNLEIGDCYKIKNFLQMNEKNNNFEFYAHKCIILYWWFNKFSPDQLSSPVIYTKSYFHSIFIKNRENIFSKKTKYIITINRYPLHRLLVKYAGFSDSFASEYSNNFSLVQGISNDSQILIYKRKNYKLKN